jgi:hypothetical protein
VHLWHESQFYNFADLNDTFSAEVFSLISDELGSRSCDCTLDVRARHKEEHDKEAVFPETLR